LKRFVFTVPLVVLLCAGSQAAARSGAGLSGSWIGTYTLNGPGQVALVAGGGRAVVALGVGHADVQIVPARINGAHIRFQLPGRPAPLAFEARLTSGRLIGTVKQGPAHGTFRARRGTAPGLFARGLYTTGGRVQAVVDDPYGPARLVDLESGAVHGLYPAGPTFLIGSGFATREPVGGAARFDVAGARLSGAIAARRRLRQLEVRFPSGTAVLSGTLTLPSGPGRHPAVAFVHGSGPTQRAYLPDLQALLVRNGVAVLAYDKRGIGQSGGFYPGESPTDGAIDVLARDAGAASRFLRSQPGIDPARVGLAGHSQAGWIAPLAASREPGIHFLVVFSGPAVTTDENDLYQDLAGEGERPAELTDAAIDAQVIAAGPGGVDPLPWIRRLKIPALWVYGGRDRHVPPRLSERRLEPIAREPGRDFTIADFQKANHALVETTTGLTAEMLRSDTFAPGLFARVGDWLRAHRLAG
jgi:pimeloyl-ACP methyl ester carboxylesterase